MFKFRKIKVPASNETREQDVVELWEVQWESRHDKYHNDTKPEIEVFVTEESARDFAKSLNQAFSLIRHTSGNKVTIKKRA